MTYKDSIHGLSFGLSRANWQIFVVSLAVLWLLFVWVPGRWKAVAVRQQQDEKTALAQKLFDEGAQFYQQGTAEALRNAIQKFEKALLLCRELGDRQSQALLLQFLGRTNQDLGEGQLALQFYTQALPLLRAVGDRRGEAITLSNLGGVYNVLGEKQKALDFYTQALPLLRATGDRGSEAAALTGIGAVYEALGEKQKALDLYAQALPLLRAAGDRGGEARTLNNIGAVYNALGERQKALDFYAQALPIMSAVGDRNGEAVTLNNTGLAYDSLGEKQKALDFYSQALAILRAIGDRRTEASTLNNIGLAYHTLGEQQKALDFYSQALGLRRAVGDRGGEAVTLTNIGGIYKDLGEKQKALGFYEQALLLQRTIGDRGNQAITLSNIGACYDALGEQQKALGFFAQTLTLQRAVGDRSGEATTLNNIGGVHRDLGEIQTALDLYAQALALSRAVGNRRGEAITLNNIARAERALGRLDDSRAHIEECLKITESLRAEVVSRELRASFFSTAQGRYEFYVDLLMKLHRQEPAKNYHAAALQATERSRARSLLESLTEARADIRRGVDPNLLARERSLQQRLNAKAEEVLKLSATGVGQTRLAASKREVDALTDELQQVQTQIRQTSPRYAALTQPQPLTPVEIQQQVLDDDTLLLEYSLGNERSFLWAVTSTTLNSYELPPRAEIEAAALRVYELLSAFNRSVPGQTAEQRNLQMKQASGQFVEAASQLSRMLLAPAATEWRRKRLVIVADGALHYIPFGALPDPAMNNSPMSDGLADKWKIVLPSSKPSSNLQALEDNPAQSFTPLIVNHEIINLPSASTLAVLRRELAGRKPAPKTLAVLADPVFMADDERVKGQSKQPAANSPETSAGQAQQRILKQLARERGEMTISRLPFTRQEAEQILAIAPAGEGMKALSFEASRATATSDQLSQYRYVHFATHGLADSERPELSTILLSLFDEQGKPQDGFLRAHEIYNLSLPAEMVVLSACETGLGKQVRGEGLVSLTRGFMYAGAARVLVSLWSVNDRATAELMTKFYRKMLVEGQRPAAALRAAQVEMWRTRQWEAPYYWAAFTLQGEWR